MFVISGVLFAVALILLPVGLLQDGLGPIYGSIAMSVASIVGLVIGVRRRPALVTAGPEPAGATGPPPAPGRGVDPAADAGQQQPGPGDDLAAPAAAVPPAGAPADGEPREEPLSGRPPAGQPTSGGGPPAERRGPGHCGDQEPSHLPVEQTLPFDPAGARDTPLAGGPDRQPAPTAGAPSSRSVPTTRAPGAAKATPARQAPAAKTTPAAGATAPARSARARAVPAGTGSRPVTGTQRGAMVVVIPNAGRFHRTDCRYVRGADRAQQMTRQQALDTGSVACGICHP